MKTPAAKKAKRIGRRSRVERFTAFSPVIAVVLSIGVAAILNQFRPKPAFVGIGFVVTFASTMATGVITNRSARRKAIERLVAHQRKLCLACRYPLDGLGDFGACPECGLLFEVRILKLAWLRTYPELQWAELDAEP